MIDSVDTVVRRRRWTYPRAGASVVALVLVAGAAWHWVDSPGSIKAYPSYGMGAPVAVGQDLFVDLSIVGAHDGTTSGPTTLTVTVDSVLPRIVEDTTDATVVIFICVRNGSNQGVGTDEAKDLAASCSSVHEFHGPATVRLGFDTTQLLLRVTPRRAGVLRISGVTIDYQQGIRRGSQHAGPDMTFTATG